MRQSSTVSVPGSKSLIGLRYQIPIYPNYICLRVSSTDPRVECILLDGCPHIRGPITITANKIDEFFEKWRRKDVE